MPHDTPADKHDTAEAVDFVRRWGEIIGGLVSLTAIKVDPKKDERKTWTITVDMDLPDAVKKLTDWIDARNDRVGFYFAPNPPRGLAKKKLSRADVGTVCTLHVDVDPREGEDLEAEQRRILALARTCPLPPSVIIFSGGGFQFFFPLKESIPIEPGNAELIAKIERHNKLLIQHFGGDPACFDISHLMRLPWTINKVNAAKRKRGRKDVLATLERFDDTRFELDDLTDAFGDLPEGEGKPGNGADATNSNVDVDLDIDWASLPKVSVAALPLPVDAGSKAIIMSGDAKAYGGDRSRALLHMACVLTCAGCLESEVAAVLMDPANGISAHAYDTGDPQRAVTRAILKALAETDPELVELNRKFFVARDGGKVDLFSWEHDHGLNRDHLDRLTFAELKKLYCHRRKQIGFDDPPKYMPLGKWWVEHRERRQYEGIVFAPNEDVPGKFNMFRGFGIEPKPGDWSLGREHIRDVICSGNATHFDYCLNWLARAVQAPGRPGEVAPVLRGDQGVGKGKAFAWQLAPIFGQHFLYVNTPRLLTGNFNAHLRDAILIFADEAFFAGDHTAESVLKSLITEPMIAVEAKGMDVTMAPNLTHTIIASNSEWIVPAGIDDRRYFVQDVSDERKGDAAYFTALMKQMDSGGREAMLFDLLARDISKFNVRDVPQTAALLEQKMLSLTPVEKWWHEKLMDGELLPGTNLWGEVRKAALHDDYLRIVDKTRDRGRRSTESELGRRLRKVLPAGWPRDPRRWVSVFCGKYDRDGQPETELKRVQFYEVPTLTECRNYWDEIMRTTTQWPDDGPL